jgi:hypothetical protein
VFAHAVLALRWFRDATPITTLARDAGIGISTYRYPHEAIDVLAARAPELPDVLHARLTAGDTHVVLDGMLIHIDRVATTCENEAGTIINGWYSSEHQAFGGNIQFVSTAEGLHSGAPMCPWQPA